MTRAALALVLTGLAAGAAAAAAPLYAVIRVGSALAEDDRVGVRGAGLACLPAGRIRWRDVATGGVMDQREIVQDALEDAGVAVTSLGLSEARGGRRALRLRATVQAAAFRLCARHYLGDARALSGDAALVVEWRVENGADGSETAHVVQVARHIDGKDAASLGAIYRRLIGDAAREAALWLARPSP